MVYNNSKYATPIHIDNAGKGHSPLATSTFKNKKCTCKQVKCDNISKCPN